MYLTIRRIIYNENTTYFLLFKLFVAFFALIKAAIRCMIQFSNSEMACERNLPEKHPNALLIQSPKIPKDNFKIHQK